MEDSSVSASEKGIGTREIPLYEELFNLMQPDWLR